MQKGMFRWKQPMYRPEKLLANLASAARWARDNGIPVIYLQHDDDTFLSYGSADWEFLDVMSPEEGDTVIRKRYPNAFMETGLHEFLQKEGISELIVGGVNSNYCVQASCEGAVALGYHVTLMKNGHSTVYKNPEKVIEDVQNALAEKGVEIRTVGEVTGQGIGG